MKSDYDFLESRKNPYSSRVLESIHKAAQARHKAGPISDRKMQDFDRLCLESGDISAINSETGYNMVLSRLDELMQAGAGSEQGRELDKLATLIEAYERKNF